MDAGGGDWRVSVAASTSAAADFVGEKNAMGAANELLSASGIWGIWGMVKVGIDAATDTLQSPPPASNSA